MTSTSFRMSSSRMNPRLHTAVQVLAGCQGAEPPSIPQCIEDYTWHDAKREGHDFEIRGCNEHEDAKSSCRHQEASCPRGGTRCRLCAAEQSCCSFHPGSAR